MLLHQERNLKETSVSNGIALPFLISLLELIFYSFSVQTKNFSFRIRKTIVIARTNRN